MAKARIKFGLVSKFQQVLNDWAGREATHIISIETIDDQGNMIDRSETESEITALIGNPSTNTNMQPPGTFQSGDLCMYSKIADDIKAFEQLTDTTTRQDRIRYEGITYRTELIDTMYDVDEESIRVFKLKKIAV
jgi:hypothetical protein